MSIRALITEGIGPGGSVKYILTLGLDLAAATVPSAPTIGTAVAGDTQASVSFTESVSNGGSVILSHTATSTPGGITATLIGAGSGTIIVTGLTNGVSYTFTVHSTNAVGDSVESAASNSVTPSVPAVVDTGIQGGGPGWNIVWGGAGKRKRKADTLRQEIEEAYRRATEAESPRETREAVKELKRVAAETVSVAQGTEDYAEMAAQLQALRQIEISAVAYLDRINAILAEQKARDDDEQESIAMIFRLA